MRRLALTLILAPSLCVAAPRCPDPKSREATTGVDTITGGVVHDHKPVKFAQVRLYSLSGKAVWTGTTDKNGTFATGKMQPGEYRLEVGGWGSVEVQLNPEADKDPSFGGGTPAWSRFLFDNAGVSALASMN
jgi:Carboxypeptidase regulatory-like domain